MTLHSNDAPVSRGDADAASHPPRRVSPERSRRGRWSEVPDALWSDWRWQQAHRLRTAEALDAAIGLTSSERAAFDACAARFRVAITPYYASLIRPGDPRCPIRAQAVPAAGELAVTSFEQADPLDEEAHSPVPALVHRYPDRVLLYASHNCPVYCRHCTRKRKVSDPASAASRDDVALAIDWIARHSEVRDVLVSGGDPLTLSDDRLGEILDRIAAIPHVEWVRLGTRNPVTLPQRITPALCNVLRGIRPLYLHTHFNHPNECTPEAASALEALADAGCVLGNQMVLLRGVNDDADVVRTLNRWLLRHRCRPYYMFQADMAEGITHFRTPLARGMEIVAALRGTIGGMGIPHFAVDLPGGGGKITLTPEALVRREGERWTFRGPRGTEHVFHDVADSDA